MYVCSKVKNSQGLDTNAWGKERKKENGGARDVSPARQRTSGVMRLTKLVLTLLLLGLAGQAACQEDDYGEDDFGGGGGYGEEEEEEDPPPAPAGDGAARELSSVADLEAFMDDNDASVVGAFLEKEMPDPAAVMPEDWDEDEDGTW